jgi:hypothetical protein
MNARIIRVLICALVAVGAAIGQTDQQTGELIISTEPAGAVVSCDGVVKGTTPATVSGIAAGQHLVVASKPGYSDARKTIAFSPGEKVPVNMKLDQLLGLVLVHSEPQGADVQINGADRGKTPVLLSDLPIGDYRLKLSMTGHQPKEVDLQVKDRTPKKLTINLSSSSASLTVDSEPVGAKLVLNGADKGVTPCTLDRVPEGDSTVELTMEGYTPFHQTIKLVSGQKGESLKAVLKPLMCEIKVVSIPPKARVYLDNQFKGETPIDLTDLAPGTYRIRAELRGYEIVARSVPVKGGEKKAEEFRLVKNSGLIELTTEPSGVRVFLDGEDVGLTKAKPDETDRVSEPLTIDMVSTGDRKLQLTRKGYVSTTVAISVEKDKTATLHQALERRFIPDYKIRTGDATYTGVFIDRDIKGNIKIEVRPGIIKTIPKGEIREQEPLRDPDVNPPGKSPAPARPSASAKPDTSPPSEKSPAQ